MINRLRDLMTSVFPSLERTFDYSAHKGARVLLTGYASPDRIRRIGQTRLADWLRNRRVRGFADVAVRAITAAKAQSVVLPGQDLSAAIIAELASAILTLDERVKTLDAQIQKVFAEHPQAEIIESMPDSAPSSVPHCWSAPVNYAHFPAPAISLQQPAWCPSRTIPAGGPVICTALCGTAVRYDTCSTFPRRPA